jgi:hypothetical protein
VTGSVVFPGAFGFVVGEVADVGVVEGTVVVGGASVVVVDGGGAEPFHCTVLSVDVDASDAFAVRSEAAPAPTLATTVPELAMPVTDTVYVAPLPLTDAANVPPTVLPANETSLASKPVTASLNSTENTIGDVDVGSGCATPWSIVTDGETAAAGRAIANDVIAAS